MQYNANTFSSPHRNAMQCNANHQRIANIEQHAEDKTELHAQGIVTIAQCRQYDAYCHPELGCTEVPKKNTQRFAITPSNQTKT